MNHASNVEIHDHAWGFQASPHAAACDACRGQADAAAAERDALREWLATPDIAAPPELLLKLSLKRRRRDTVRKVPAFSIWGVAAAAAVLACLGGILFHGTGRPVVPFVPVAPQASGDDLDRLIAERKSANPLRREIAELALWAHGEAAAEKLVAAGLPLPGRSKPQDLALRRRCETEKITFNSFSITFERALLFFRDDASDVIVDIEEDARRHLQLDFQGEFQVGEQTMHNALRLLIQKFGGGGRVNILYENGRIVLSTFPPPRPSLVPVRPVRDHESAPVLVFALRNESRRAATTAALARLGFGAEKALWGALDAPEAHVRDAAADLLRRLYTPAGDALDHAPRIDMMRRIGHPVDEQDASLYDVLDRIRLRNFKMTEFDPAAEAAMREKKVSYRFQGSWYGHFTLLLDSAGMHFVAGRKTVAIRLGERSLDPWAPMWLPPAEAKRVQTLIDALSSPDPKVEEEAWRGITVDSLEGEALAAVRQAAWLLEGPLKERARALREKLLKKVFEGEKADAVSGVDLQALDAAQTAILQRRVDARGKLDRILADAGMKARILARPQQDRGVTLNGVRVVALLRAVTLPYGLDFYMDGETVVIDTAANVRAVVER